jgi:hypothetical protein
MRTFHAQFIYSPHLSAVLNSGVVRGQINFPKISTKSNSFMTKNTESWLTLNTLNESSRRNSYLNRDKRKRERERERGQEGENREIERKNERGSRRERREKETEIEREKIERREKEDRERERI